MDDDEGSSNGLDELLAQLMPNLDPAVIRSALGWPAAEAPGPDEDQTGTGWPK